MMCSARLFTRVVKPDFTEHRSAVCAWRPNVIARVYFVDRSYSFLPDHQALRLSSLDLRCYANQELFFQLNCMHSVYRR